MKTRDIFRTPIIHLTPYQSVDVSRFLHASEATGTHRWTFVSSGDAGEWESTQVGTFRTAMKEAIRNFCTFYQTKYARLLLTSMEEV